MKKWALVCAFAALATAQERKLAFEVATIKLSTSGDGRALIDGGPGMGGRLRVTNLPLRQLIILAYADRSRGPVAPGGGNISLTGGPGWIATDRYDIDARPEAGFTPTQEQSQIMLQALLEERFGLKVRRETKDGPIYALVVGKDGVANKPGLKKSADQTPVGFGPPPGGPGGPPPPGFNPRGMMALGLGNMRASAQTLSGLAGMLSAQAGRKVVDRTNLAGLYDFELKWTPDQLPNGAQLPPGAQLPQIDPNGPSLFTAIQEQMGLKLEPATGPLESLVIEKVEKPTEN